MPHATKTHSASVYVLGTLPARFGNDSLLLQLVAVDPPIERNATAYVRLPLVKVIDALTQAGYTVYEPAYEASPPPPAPWKSPGIFLASREQVAVRYGLKGV